VRPPEPDELGLFRGAKENAEKLVTELLARRAELNRSDPTVPEDQLAAGRTALDRAIESAKRMVESLDAAIRAAGESA
jgi:hypothetical protein